MNNELIKKLVSFFMLFSLILVGCSENNIEEQNKNRYIERNVEQDNREFNEVEAIAKVIQGREEFSHFPKEPGKVEGVIQGGGPSPGIKVPGVFETKIEQNEKKGSFIVIFIQHWKYEDFHYEGEGKKGDILNHYWKFRVTETKVAFIESRGNFPPQLVK